MSDSQASLPVSLQIVGFAVTLVLATIKILDFSNRPKLNVHLTKDVFFRLIDSGEALFCNVVLLASNGPVLIRTVQLMLKRVDDAGKSDKAEKRFPLEVTQFGEKVRGTQVTADNHFFGSSPLLYLGPSTPYRAVYLCLHPEYRDGQQRAVDQFVLDLQKFRDENQNSTSDKEKLLAEFHALIERHYHSMTSLIQLESGHYELELKVSYQSLGMKLLTSQKTVSSSITFEVEAGLIEAWKSSLKSSLQLRGQQFIENLTANFPYPTLEPRRVEELSSKQ
jgi:hypothetical protein